MNKLITVSENAIKQIKKIIANAETEVDGVIIDVDKSGCSGYSYKLDYAKNPDESKYEVIEKDGIKVFIEPKATMFILVSKMDYVDNGVESGFTFDNPNEKGRCGCGESFSI